MQYGKNPPKKECALCCRSNKDTEAVLSKGGQKGIIKEENKAGPVHESKGRFMDYLNMQLIQAIDTFANLQFSFMNYVHQSR